MDWKGAQLWVFYLLVICSVVFGNANPEKKFQDDSDGLVSEPSLKSESKVTFLAVENRDPHHDSSHSRNISRHSVKKGSIPLFQIEKPVIIKQSRQGPKTLVRKRKVLRPSENQNITQDSSIPEESLRIEEIRDTPQNSFRKTGASTRNVESHTLSRSEAHFVPSETFPKNIVSHSQPSSSRSSKPFANGDIKYVLAFTPDSSEEKNSRSDVSSEEFDSRRDPPKFNNHHYSNLKNNQHQDNPNQDHSRSAFPTEEAQKVTIIKEKTIHSTSSEAAQERVNIEKNQFHKEPSNNEEVVRGHPRTFHLSENPNLEPRTVNREEKIILVEGGTQIPGRNYGPEDDTFGFYANSYADEKTSSQPSNGRRVKVVKVVKTRSDNGIPTEDNFNNHGNGQSRQYFVNDQQNVYPEKGRDVQSSNRHNSNENQAPLYLNVPQIQQTESHFVPEQTSHNFEEQIKHVSRNQNPNFGHNLNKQSLRPGDKQNSRVQSYDEGGQHVMLNINPDPNELYIDENTGQLIKFVIRDDSSNHSPQNIGGEAHRNQRPSEDTYSQGYQEIQGDARGQLSVKHSGQNQVYKNGEDSGKHNNLRSFQTSGNEYVNQLHNQNGENVQYIQVSDDDAVHLIIPSDGNSGEEKQQVYYIPPKQTSDNEYSHSQGVSNSNVKDDSEEYVVLCDQEGQDYSAEFQSGDIGSTKYGQNTGTNNRNQFNFKSNNQLQTPNYVSSDNINHNKGQSFKSSNQGQNSGYKTNLGNMNLQRQKFGSRLPNLNGKGNQFKNIGQSQGSSYGNNQGSEGTHLGNNKGVTNFATPPTINGIQGHYQGSDFSNTKHNSQTPVYREVVTPAYPINDDFPPIKGQSKGQNYQFPQNQGNLKKSIGGSISSDNYNKGPGVMNQNDYDASSKGFSDNKGYDGGKNILQGVISIDHNQGPGLNLKGYNDGSNAFSGNNQLNGHNKGTQYPAGKGQNKGNNQFSSDGGYNSGENFFSSGKGHNEGSGVSNQKGYNQEANLFSGITQSHGINKGSEFSNANRFDKGNSGAFKSEGYNSGGQSKVSGFSGEKGYNTGKNEFSGNLGKGISFANQKGYNSGNSGSSNNQKHNFGGAGYEQGLSINEHDLNSGVTNQKGYGKGQNLFSGGISLNAHSNNAEFSGQKEYTQGNNAFSNNQGYNSGEQFNNNLALKGDYGDAGNLNQKGINIESNILQVNKGHDLFQGAVSSQDFNKGSGISSQKGYDSGNNVFSGNQGYQTGDGPDIFSGAISSKGFNKGSGISNQKGYDSGNNAFTGNQGYQTGDGADIFSGAVSSKGFNKGSGISSQKGYDSGNNAFSGNQGYQTGDGADIFSGAISSKGFNKGSGISSQKGYDSGNNAFSGNQGYQTGDGANIFSGAISSNGFNKGSGISSQKGYDSGNNAFSGNQEYQKGGGAEIFSGAVSSKGSEFPNNKGYNSGNNIGSGNQGYKSNSFSESFSGSLSSNGLNKGSEYSNQNNYDAGNNAFKGNKGYNAQSNSFSNNKGYQSGTNTFSGNIHDNFKGTPMKVPQNNDYNQHMSSVSAHNNFKGTNLKQSGGNYGRGNQNSGGYSGGSSKGALKIQQQNPGNNNYGVSYSTSGENSGGQQHSGEQGPVQYILVEEDAPGYKKGNNEAVYFLQNENNGYQPNGGNSQEKTYLIIDDSNQQHQNVRYMVDGGKDRTFPIRQLATVGMHMANAVLPQLQNTKAKKIKGKISFGVEINKGQQYDQSDGSQHYLESRSDRRNQRGHKKQAPIQ